MATASANHKIETSSAKPSDGLATEMFDARATQSLPEKVMRVVVVGAGPVGIRFANELLKRKQDSLVQIKLFGDEPYAPYDRIKLSQLLAHSIRYESIFSKLPESKTVEGHATDAFQYISQAVASVDVVSKKVIDKSGNAHYYDKLVLAVGSKPHIPNLPGVDLKGVYTFRNMRDTESLMARTNRSRHVVVVGGGLLGLEVARGLKSSATEVTLVHQSGRLMNRQLNELPAKELLKRVQAQKIGVIVNDGLAKVLDHPTVKGRVEGIVTRKGRRINCDTVILCTGIKPNTELALNAGIRFSRGIIVDDSLQTSVPDVYAIGECCEHRNEIYGLVAPGLEQASVLADIICDGTSTYQGTHPYTQLKVVDELVSSVGEITDLAPRPKQQILNYRKSSSGDCRSIAVHKGCLVGACAVGDWQENQRVREALLTQRYIFPWQRLWFSLTGKLWFGSDIQNAAYWPANAIVCQCNQLSKERIEICVAQGAQSVAAVGVNCGAGTVCGSCQPQVAEIVSFYHGVDAANDASSGATSSLMPGLLTFSALAFLVAIALWIFPGIQSPTSVQTPSLSFLWQDSFYKQVSGFSLVGVTVIGLILSLRKRLGWKFLGEFSLWRYVHTVLGILALGILFFHTGANLGENLNRYLMINFLVAASVGALLGVAVSLNKNTALGSKIRKLGFWAHVLTLWPLPILLSAHVISSYYF